MSDDLKFTCQVCGAQIEAEPDVIRETFLSPVLVTEEEHNKALSEGDVITPDQLRAMSHQELEEIGLTPNDRDKLLNGETVETGAMCVCKKCQDEAANE